MSSNNNQSIENQIKQGLAKGLSSGDFSGLNSAISDSVKGALKEASESVSDSLKEASSQMASELKKATNPNSYYGYRKPHSTPEESRRYAQELQERRAAHDREVRARAEALRLQREAQRAQAGTALAAKKIGFPAKFDPIGSVSAPLCMVGGGVGLVFTSIELIKNAVLLGIGAAGPAGLIASGVFAVVFGIIMATGFSKQSLLNKAKRYGRICGANMYASISAIASAMGVKTSKVKSDIKKMLKKGYFPEGYLDDEATTLMLSEDVYKQYRRTQSYALTSAANKTATDLSEPTSEKAKSARAKLSQDEREELNAMINEGHEYISKLHTLNKDIPGESITRKLNELETVLTEIFTRVEEHPEQMKRMHKLMEYYLPTMLKLVEAYAEYDKVSSPGEEIISAKNEIENTLDTINEAFVQLLNNLFQDSVWDVTSDAQVLQTMLKQEGLASDMDD